MVSLRTVTSGFLLFAALVMSSGEALAAPAADGTMRVFDCENLSRVVARFSTQAVNVRLAGGNAMLPRSASASEERYSDGRITFWNAGDFAQIDEPGGTSICRSNSDEVAWEDARWRGIEIRAAGHEPEWSLEIDEQTGIDFVADSGTTRIRTSAPVPGVSIALGRTTYYAEADDHTLSIVLENRLCWHKGMGSSATVMVTVDEHKIYRGCGRPLPSGSLAGIVSYRAPMVLPAGSKLRVRIVKLGGPFETHDVIAEYTAAIEGPAPVRFEINYNRARIYGGDAYGIEATISVDGKPRLITRQLRPVVTRGSIGFVELLLEAAPERLSTSGPVRGADAQ
jgi:uncharacterized lipoprotein YbaY/membrane-bound inhibitor of C-type lysozyme